jgi:hypothetical protein
LRGGLRLRLLSLLLLLPLLEEEEPLLLLLLLPPLLLRGAAALRGGERAGLRPRLPAGTASSSLAPGGW